MFILNIYSSPNRLRIPLSLSGKRVFRLVYPQVPRFEQVSFSGINSIQNKTERISYIHMTIYNKSKSQQLLT